MGVYIASMQMPKRCDECSIRAMALSWCSVAKRSTSHSDSCKPLDQSRRPSWCPLVEVKTPHGNLIDRDAVKASMIPLSFSVQNWIDEVTLDTRIPVVIEAEGGKNDKR